MKASHRILRSIAGALTLLLVWSLTGAQDSTPNASQGAPPQPAKSEPTTSIEIGSPEHFHKRVIALDGSIPVVVTNMSKQPLRIWRDWCSWGYQQLSFEFRDDAGHTWTISKKEHEFWKNYPDYWTLAPGEPLVLNVALSADIWEIVGGPLADLRGKALTVQAIFTAESDDQSRENNVWTGRVTSTARVYQVD